MTTSIEKDCVLLTEGSSDKQFFDQLLRALGLTNLIQAFCPHDLGDQHRGKDAFPAVLNAIKGIRPGVQAVILAADSDDDPDTAFSTSASMLVAAGYPHPDSPDTLKRENRRSSAVLMVPRANASGCLETLLYEAACEEHTGARDCVQGFEECVDPGWSSSKLAKLRFHALVSGYCQKNPGCSPRFIWRSNTRLVRITNSRFDDIRERLSRLAADLRPHL